MVLISSHFYVLSSYDYFWFVYLFLKEMLDFCCIDDKYGVWGSEGVRNKEGNL